MKEIVQGIDQSLNVQMLTGISSTNIQDAYSKKKK